MNVSVDVYNDFIHSSVVNISIVSSANIERSTVYVTFASQKDSNRSWKTVVDFEKLLNDRFGNLFFKIFMDNFAESIDFEPKFPMLPVSIAKVNTDLNNLK